MFKQVSQIVSSRELKREIPVSAAFIEKRSSAIEHIDKILFGDDKRKLVIVGPCSANDPTAVRDYAERLSRIKDELSDKLYIVMRVFTAKPRSRGEGYMGLVHTPTAGGATDINGGLKAMRRLHIGIAEDFGVFTADELLYPDIAPYVDDVLSYATVGARSCEDILHRFVASGMDIPVGVKNPVNGNPYELVSSVHAVSIANEFMFGGCQVETDGNRAAHAVLRGGTDVFGNYIPNYDENSVLEYCDHAQKQKVAPSVIIDTGHANSGKDISRVAGIVDTVAKSLRSSSRYNEVVKGIMIESYIESGCGAVGRALYGQSVTDPCIGWEQTKELLYSFAQNIP